MRDRERERPTDLYINMTPERFVGRVEIIQPSNYLQNFSSSPKE